RDELIFIFFFSSRRRHTRCYRDWSSDVCSSDLTMATRKKAKPAAGPDLEITIVPNEPAAPKQDHVNVRGRAGINSEVVTHLNRKIGRASCRERVEISVVGG